MKIAVAKEIDPSEPRVAASPDTICEMSLETSSAFIAGARSETSNAAPGAS